MAMQLMRNESKELKYLRSVILNSVEVASSATSVASKLSAGTATVEELFVGSMSTAGAVVVAIWTSPLKAVTSPSRIVIVTVDGISTAGVHVADVLDASSA